MDVKKDITFRLATIYFLVIGFSVLIIGQVFYIQFINKEQWLQKERKLTFKDITIKAHRGDIMADDGKLLASSVPYYEIRMDMASPAMTDEIFNQHVDSLAISLASFFKDKSALEYRNELREARHNGERYHLIQKNVSYIDMKTVKTFPLFRLGLYKGGFIEERYQKRHKAYDMLASRTIGFLSEGAGATGIEQAYDDVLRGKDGIRLVQKLSNDILIPINDGNEIEPVDGSDVLTTINLRFQDITERALLKQLELHQADHGCAVLMEVSSGEVKAIANLGRDKKGKYFEKYNYAIGTSAEPGSTFKLMSLMVALEDGYVDLNNRVSTGNGTVSYSKKFRIRDAHKGGMGNITVQQAFELSSNVAVSKIIHKYYQNQPEKFVDRIYAAGLNEKLGIELKGEGKPYIKYPDQKLWWNISLPQMSIGYEVHLTPLQTLTFYNAIANNGKMVKPKFVKEIRRDGQVIKRFPNKILKHQVCSPQTVRKLQKMMEGVVLRGTARNIYNKTYRIAGKTGTAQLLDPKTKSYVARYRASFVGYFPADNPQYSCIVLINNPRQNGYYGSVVAAPVFRAIADKVYATSLKIARETKAEKAISYDRIPHIKTGYRYNLDYILKTLNIKVEEKKDKRDNWVVAKRGSDHVSYSSWRAQKKKVPRVVGMGLRDALYILGNMGFQTKVKGRGTVRKQSLQAGSIYQHGDTISIELD